MQRSPSLLLCALSVLAGSSGCATDGGARAAGGGVMPKAAPFALPFIDDDYDRAVAEARARGLPLFVDAWAPW